MNAHDPRPSFHCSANNHRLVMIVLARRKGAYVRKKKSITRRAMNFEVNLAFHDPSQYSETSTICRCAPNVPHTLGRIGHRDKHMRGVPKSNVRPMSTVMGRAFGDNPA